MKIVIFYFFCLTILTVVSAIESWESPVNDVNLTDWREHRRKKRFIIFEHSGGVKFVAGITYPVDLQDKKPWRQLVTTYNLQFQYAEPTKPTYWWDKWDRRNLAGGSMGPHYHNQSEELQTDEAQVYLYAFAESLMDRHETNGRECLLKAICENAQIHEHQGLYSEILDRLLRPHRNLDSHYVDARRMGLESVDCKANYPKALNCLLDKYTHVREDYMGYTTVK